MARVLIGCEYSAAVRDAFRALGHDAWSCDLLPCEGDPHWHLQRDVLTVLDMEWDAALFHPPCPKLCNSGVRWLSPKGVLNPKRHAEMQQAGDFFAALYHAPIPRVAVENPIMHCYARDYLASAWKVPKQTQIIQPWQHGHGETKATALWLRNLPPITPSQIVSGREPRVHYASPGPSRWKERSRTLPGVAKAFAEQWSKVLSAPPASTTG